MMETLMTSKQLENQANKNTINEYLKTLGNYGDITVLEKFVNELPKKERLVIRLKFWENFDHDEISHHAKIRRSHVDEVLVNAISLLRKKMLTKLAELEPEWTEQNTLMVG
jgi:DNA-directed RNA polymerase specialized sigma24 family protein